MDRSLSLAHLMAFTSAACRNYMAHLGEFTRAERMMPKGSPERQHIERTDFALSHVYNEGLRAVIRAPVSTIEEARAKAAFLLRPEFEVADLILGDDTQTVSSLLRSLLPSKAAPSTTPDPLLALVTEYRTQLDAFNASPRTLSQAEDTALEAKTWGPSYAVLMGGDVPSATTLSGAVAALRELHREFVDCGGADHMAIAVLPAVVSLFDATTAQQMKDRAGRVSGS